MPFVYQIPSRTLFYKDRANKTLTIVPTLIPSDANVGKYLSSNFVNNGATISTVGVASGFGNNKFLSTKPFAVSESVRSIAYSYRLTYSTASNAASGTKIFTTFGINSSGDGVRFGINNNNQYLMLDGLNKKFDSIAFPKALKTGDVLDCTFTFTKNNVNILVYVNGAVAISTDKAAVIDNLDGTPKTVILGTSGTSSNYYFTGSIDLKQFVISMNGTQVYRGSVPTPDPAETVVTLTSAGRTVVSETNKYLKGSTVAYTVSHPYFTSVENSVRIAGNTTIPVSLNEYEWFTLTINTSQENSIILFTSTDGYQSSGNTFRAHKGSVLTYEVSKIGYVTETGTVTLNKDETIYVEQNLTWRLYTSKETYTGAEEL